MKPNFPKLRSRETSRYCFAVIASLLGLGLLACGGGDQAGSDEVEPGAFLAFESSFRGFREWEAFRVADAPGADPIDAGETTDAESPVDAGSAPDGGNPHTGSNRVAYLNRRPPAGSINYPTGSIIVKEVHQSDGKIDVVARVKRGGTYNAQGAKGWEWFELNNTSADATSTILWRGVGPPAGESYLGNVEGGCNACHRGSEDNLSILLPVLRPSSF